MNLNTHRKINKIKFVSFNCHSLISAVDYVRTLCQTADFLALQETWLLPDEVPYLGNIHQDFAYIGKSSVDVTAGPLKGRSHGGLGILWRRNIFHAVSVIDCVNSRIAAVKVALDEREFLVFSVYMPTDSANNLDEFIDCLAEINAVIETCSVDSAYILGDFNAHPGSLFGTELLDFCVEQKWTCVDVERLGVLSNSYTYLSDAWGTTSWLDHIITTEVATKSVSSVNIRYEVSWSDHFAVELVCDLQVLVPKLAQQGYVPDSATWGDRDRAQINQYWEVCSANLRDIDFPNDMQKCGDIACNNLEHRLIIDKMYDKIVSTLRSAAAECSTSYNLKRRRKRNMYVMGWNKHCKDAHREARLRFHNWIALGKPKSGHAYQQMREARRTFKDKVKWCKKNQTQIKMDILATQHSAKDFSKFWKETNKLNPKPSVPGSVEGISDSGQIANAFREHFRVKSPLVTANAGASDIRLGEPITRITAKQVARVVSDMKRGKSPGHDSLSIEHLQYAGVHLPRVLAMLFTFCVGHSYLPKAMMKTVVVPIVKNKTGDVSSLGNYRPISLATVIAKVLDGIIDIQLRRHVKLHDAQFGFRPGLSTETAILNLKHTVQYYTDRGTPVYACFLDLSKAFDLVAYDRLWHKLSNDTDLPHEFVSLLRYWYGNQSNFVKWSGSQSDMYRLDCGVRQGGLSSPSLFNLYIDRLIRGLSNSNVGCSIDGVCVNNISYADDMVLLSPSIRALRKLIRICECYAEEHGLRYNAVKSELMVFKSGRKTYETVPSVILNGSVLKQVSQFKYLGHWVTETLADDVDMDRERRALSIRGNMLARRFARCTAEVKATLFRAYCQSFYTCSLWVKYTKKSYSTLRVQYNNAFRALMWLPRHCGASGMFADARIDSFAAIIRKRIASLIRRVRVSRNRYLRLFASRMDLDCPIMQHWTRVHVEHSGSKPAFRLR